MIPVNQTRHHIKGVQSGNCLAACIASILEISCDEVPYPSEFKERYSLEDYQAMGRFLRNRGLDMVFFCYDEEEKPYRPPWSWSLSWDSLGQAGQYWIAAGYSDRGIAHAVVCNGPTLEHDPHPGGSGITLQYGAYLIYPLHRPIR